ncbi:hypothetical protein D3C76_1481790 [compost metagenome]
MIIGLFEASQASLAQRLKRKSVQRKNQRVRTDRQIVQSRQGLERPGTEQAHMATSNAGATFELGQSHKTRWPRAGEQLELAWAFFVNPGAATNTSIERQGWVPPSSQALHGFHQPAQEHHRLYRLRTCQWLKRLSQAR